MSLSKTITSKVIAGTESDGYKKWEIPDVSSESLQLPTAQEIERIETAAYKEGLEAGYKAGFDKGLAESQQEMQQRCSNLDKILTFLHRPLDDLDEKVTEQLFHLAMTVTGQLIRRELHTDPGQIVAVVREAMASLPIAERKVNIYLHPEDASIVRDVLSLHHDSESQPWRIIEDPLLSRGGCRLQAGQSYIDATIETRLNRIIAALLGGERDSDLNVYADTSIKDEAEQDNTAQIPDSTEQPQADLSDQNDPFDGIEARIEEASKADKSIDIDKEPDND